MITMTTMITMVTKKMMMTIIDDSDYDVVADDW